MTLALFPGFASRLLQLPGIEAGSESSGNRLALFSPFVVSEPIVCQTECFGKHPAVAVILVQKLSDSPPLKILEGDPGMNRQPQLRRLGLLISPESLCIESTGILRRR